MCDCKLEARFDAEDMKLDCPRTYDMMAASPLGLFQLEGPTAKKWVPKFKPRTFEELSDFISLDRTGPIKAGMMDEYLNVKDGKKKMEFLHPDLKPILEKTKGALVYQEQIMEICWYIAGLTLGEADNIRKAVGKKKPDLMAKCKDMFVNGCVKKGYTQELGDTLWGYIDKFSGYGFNKSHSICYAMTAYMTAWAKTHFTTEFYTALLKKAGSGVKEEGMEIMAIVNDAKLHDIEILKPSLARGNLDFEIVGEKQIVFGLGHIKGIGPSSLPELNKSKGKTFYEFLANAIKNRLKKTIMEGLIWSGALDEYNVSRFQMASDFQMLQGLTEKELDEVLPEIEAGKTVRDELWRISDSLTIEGRKTSGEYAPNKRRCITLRELVLEADKVRKSASFIISLAKEKLLLGVTLSGNETDLYDSNYAVDNCIDFAKAKDGTKLRFICIVESVREHIDRNKNKMAFIKLSDSTYMLDAVVFASTFKKCGYLIQEDRVVMVAGKKQEASFLIDSVRELY